jgi:hypothetical protein
MGPVTTCVGGPNTDAVCVHVWSEMLARVPTDEVHVTSEGGYPSIEYVAFAPEPDDVTFAHPAPLSPGTMNELGEHVLVGGGSRLPAAGGPEHDVVPAPHIEIAMSGVDGGEHAASSMWI